MKEKCQRDGMRRKAHVKYDFDGQLEPLFAAQFLLVTVHNGLLREATEKGTKKSNLAFLILMLPVNDISPTIKPTARLQRCQNCAHSLVVEDEGGMRRE